MSFLMRKSGRANSNQNSNTELDARVIVIHMINYIVLSNKFSNPVRGSVIMISIMSNVYFVIER